MTSLWFVVPAHGRVELARICLGVLRDACDNLEREGVRASAVVVADDENLDTARDLGFGTVERDNTFLSCKFNDGIQFATDPAYNRHPADYVVPCGSDDWVDWRLFTEFPGPGTMIGFQRMAFVPEDGTRLVIHDLRRIEGGCGIRIYPRSMFEPLGYRPAEEDRSRACDTSIISAVRRAETLRHVVHRDLEALQIVDWKTPGANVTPYEDVAGRHRAEATLDPYTALQGRYPEWALEAMQRHYARELVAA